MATLSATREDKKMKDVLAKEARLAVEWWPIQRPLPYAKNPRLVPEAAIVKVAASLTEYGWRQPLVVDKEGVIIVGHTRLLAAQRLGLTQVPVHVAGDLSPAQAKAYRLTDNRSAQETSWDYELLPLEIGELADLDYDLEVLGFDPDEISNLLLEPSAGLCDPDEVPEPPEEPISKPGDLWTLGAHRLLCGDSTKAADVGRLMCGKRASLMCTDPPYLASYDGGNHPQTWGKGGQKIRPEEKTKHWDSYVDHETSVEFYRSFLDVALEQALTDVPLIYQWFGMMHADVVFEAWRACSLLPHQVIIWVKSRPVLTRCDFMWNYEPCMYGWVKGKRPHSSARPPANAPAAWQIDSRVEDGASGLHPTMKPVECFRRPIAYHSKPGELIYEPFLGSGTALIAAEEMGRVCYALELSPVFCDVAVKRWENFTGRQAVRDGARH